MGAQPQRWMWRPDPPRRVSSTLRVYTPATMPVAVPRPERLPPAMPTIEPGARVTVRQLVDLVAHIAGLPRAEMLSRSRLLHLCRARQLACWLAVRFTKLSRVQIGKTIGVDHTTVLYACWRIEHEIALGDGVVEGDTPEAWARALWGKPWARFDKRTMPHRLSRRVALEAADARCPDRAG